MNCISDSDCNNDELCSFNDEDNNNYCISNNINDLYYGCINDNVYHNLESIETKSNNDDFNYMKCIDFSRKQYNNEGLEYNYMIYKPKKKTFIDTTNINIYLKCNEEILAVIPYLDYFILECDNKQLNCKLIAKNELLNFIVQNTQNCMDKNKINLEIIYECENEHIKKSKKIYIDLKKYKPIIIYLQCPIDVNNEKFKSKCDALYIDPYNIDKNNYKEFINMNQSLNNCKNPLFKVPRIIKNIDEYKKKNYYNHQMKFKNMIQK